jgi:hypothetical protein
MDDEPRVEEEDEGTLLDGHKLMRTPSLILSKRENEDLEKRTENLERRHDRRTHNGAGTHC